MRSRRTEEPEINLISLIDVLLLLVIFFMLSSTFSNEGRMNVQLPAASDKPAAAESGKIVVTVTQAGGFRVNERELVNSSRETLQRAIAEVAGTARNARVVLRADGRATHQSVVTAMDVLGKMGFSQLDIATIPPPAAP